MGSTRPDVVSCDTCQRPHHAQRLPFLCAVDARNALYKPRIAHARTLIEKEELEREVNADCGKNAALGPSTKSGAASRKHTSRTYLENCRAEEDRAKVQTDEIIASAERLRQDMERVRRDMEQRKTAMKRRRSDMATASQGLTAHRERQLEEVKRTIRILRFRWEREYSDMVRYKAALCTEVAKLYKLQRIRRKEMNRWDYKIGGIEVVDLHHVNSVHPELVSASLGHVAHLLWLTSHYLGVRLPAEIIIPHNDYPKPTIFSLASSYQHGDVPFPGTAQATHSSNTVMPHPRHLYLDKPLSTLAKEDPITYNYFLEGVCLLAYDLLWLCRTQGIQIESNKDTFEDYTNIGRNLWHLLIGYARPKADSPNQPILQSSSSSTNNEASQHSTTKPRPPQMGAWSHSAAHTHLNSKVGLELIRSFKLSNPIKLVDKLKTRLASEAPVPEWELIEDDELDGPNDLNEGVLVGGLPPVPPSGRTPSPGSGALENSGRARHFPGFGEESYMSVHPAFANAGANGLVAGPREARTRDIGKSSGSSNGWTKIRPRG